MAGNCNAVPCGFFAEALTSLCRCVCKVGVQSAVHCAHTDTHTASVKTQACKPKTALCTDRLRLLRPSVFIFVVTMTIIIIIIISDDLKYTHPLISNPELRIYSTTWWCIVSISRWCMWGCLSVWVDTVLTAEIFFRNLQPRPTPPACLTFCVSDFGLQLARTRTCTRRHAHTHTHACTRTLLWVFVRVAKRSRFFAVKKKAKVDRD